jgi:hypothetical protein
MGQHMVAQTVAVVEEVVDHFMLHDQIFDQLELSFDQFPAVSWKNPVLLLL